jgi:hypothetical protein
MFPHRFFRRRSPRSSEEGYVSARFPGLAAQAVAQNYVSSEDKSRFREQAYREAQPGLLPSSAYIEMAKKAVHEQSKKVSFLQYSDGIVTRRFYQPAMKKMLASQRGFLNPRVFIGFVLFSVTVLLPLLGLGANSASREQDSGTSAVYPAAAGEHIARSGFAPSGPAVNPVPQTGPALPQSAAPPTRSSFMAAWGSISGASGYRLDVSTSSSFSNYVMGYNDLDVGNATSRSVNGLKAGTTYYYRVRAYNSAGTNSNSNVMATTTTTGSGLTINPTFDSSITSDPNSAAIQAMINQAIAIYESEFADPITVSILFRYSTTSANGTTLGGNTLAQSNYVIYTIPWNTYINALQADATTANDIAANGSLPTNPLSTNIIPSSAGGRAVGLNTQPEMFADGTVSAGGPYDGIVTLNSGKSFQFTRPTSGGNYDALRSTEHEIDEVLGLGSNVKRSSDLRPQDLFSWSGFGNRNVSSVGLRYFSTDGGNTDIVDFNQGPNGDFGDWLSESCPQSNPYVQNAFSCPGQMSDVEASSPEGINLDVIGYDLVEDYTITTSSSPSSGGTTSGDGTFVAGTSDTVTATANSGYTFSNWTENGSVVSTSAGYTFTLNSNRTLVANFTQNQVINPPSIQTLAPISTGNTATSIEGTVTNDGGALIDGYSFSYWIDPNSPTVIDDSGITVSGNNFSAQITGLNPNATYHYRASAHNSSTVDLGEGLGWGFGTIMSFMPGPTQLGNISTRLSVGTGDNVMIGGFIINGTQPKKVIVRAIGPSLTQFGLSDVLADPTLELHDASGALIATNDNWQTTQIGGIITADQVSDIQNSGLAPTQAAESAIIAALQPGSYTAIVRGTNNTTGIALVETYDLDRTVDSKLANISTRGFVQTGDNVMIGGLIVQGIDPAKVILRAIGPSLSQFGITNSLQDPTLELHDGNGALIATNDNWQTTQIGGIITADQVSDIQNSGLAPTQAAESAIIATLQPGNYTAIVRGANNTTGIALIEAYQLGN